MHITDWTPTLANITGIPTVGGVKARQARLRFFLLCVCQNVPTNDRQLEARYYYVPTYVRREVNQADIFITYVAGRNVQVVEDRLRMTGFGTANLNFENLLAANRTRPYPLYFVSAGLCMLSQGDMGKPLSGLDHWSAIIGDWPAGVTPIRNELVLGRNSYEFDDESAIMVYMSKPKGAYIHDGWKIVIGDK